MGMWRTESLPLRNTKPKMFDTKTLDAPARASVALDPSRTGRDAEQLDRSPRRMIIGQDDAIEQIVNIHQMHLTGLNPPNRPIGNFLFLGPTGSGKTRIVEATAEALVRSSKAVIKIDCAEFQHSHEIAKLIGSPPGYLGHRETHPLLSQEVLNQYHTDAMKVSFVLFDEIEKSSDALWNLLLGILDKGTLTLGDNRKVDFSRALIFMTSNLGAQALQDGMAGGKALDATTRMAVMDQVKAHFRPEFLNRVDELVMFEPLRHEDIAHVVDHIVPEAARLRLADAVDAFCETIGFDLLQTRRVFQAAREHGLPVKLHAEQLSNMHGAALAAEFGALSADHLEHVDEAGVMAMARSGTVAVMLPGAYYFLRDTHLPPIDLFRRHAVPMAVATDCNPGSSPTTHLPLMLNMACTLLRMTPAEALLGVTRHAAQALGLLDSHGTVELGKVADLCLWKVDHPAELAYAIGASPLRARLHGGRHHPLQ